MASSTQKSSKSVWRLDTLESFTLELITSYLPFESIIQLLFVGSKQLNRRLFRDGGLKTIDFGHCPLTQTPSSIQRIRHNYQQRSNMERNFRLQSFPRGLNKVVWSQVQLFDNTSLSMLSDSLTSLIWDRAEPIFVGLGTDLAEVLPHLVCLGIEQYTVIPTSPDYATARFFRGLPSALHTLRISFHGDIIPDIFDDILPPTLTILDFTNSADSDLFNFPFVELTPIHFETKLPSTITDLRLLPYRLGDHPWKFDCFKDLSSLRLSSVSAKVRRSLPDTLTHLELVGNYIGPTDSYSPFDWPPKLSTLILVEDNVKTLSTACQHKDGPLPASVTRFRSYNNLLGYGTLISHRYHVSEMRLWFGDSNLSNIRCFADNLRSIEFPTLVVAESILHVATRCTWLQRVLFQDVSLCGVSIPEDATHMDDYETLTTWFWAYWGQKIPLVLEKSSGPFNWKFTASSNSQAALILPRGLQSFMLTNHNLKMENLPVTITRANDIIFDGKWDTPLPNLTWINLRPNRAFFALDEALIAAPKLKYLNNASLLVPLNFIDNHPHLFVSTLDGPSKPKKAKLSDYSQSNLPALGELDPEYGGPIAISKSSSSSLPLASSSEIAASSNQGASASSSAGRVGAKNSFLFPDDVDLAYLSTLDSLEMDAVNVCATGTMAERTEPLPLFECYTFTGDIQVTYDFLKHGIPRGAKEVTFRDVQFKIGPNVSFVPRLPSTVTVLSFNGAIANRFIYGPHIKNSEEFSWIPSSVTTLSVESCQPNRQDNVWSFPPLPSSLTHLTVHTSSQSINDAIIGAVPSYLSERKIAPDERTLVAKSPKGTSGKKKSSSSRDNCRIM